MRVPTCPDEKVAVRGIGFGQQRAPLRIPRKRGGELFQCRDRASTGLARLLAAAQLKLDLADPE
jgi:hypothetical protein